MNPANFENKLMVITDSRISKRRENSEIVEAAIKGGAEIIMLKERNWNKVKVREEARRLVEVCHKNNVLFILNTHVDIALTVGADGVHLEKEGITVSDAREQAGDNLIIGKTAHSIEEAIEADHEDTDYIIVSPIYPTRGEDFILGTEIISSALDCIHKPLIVSGGITSENIAEVLNEGVGTIAVSSAVVSAEDIEKAARELSDKIKNK